MSRSEGGEFMRERRLVMLLVSTLETRDCCRKGFTCFMSSMVSTMEPLFETDLLDKLI